MSDWYKIISSRDDRNNRIHTNVTRLADSKHWIEHDGAGLSFTIEQDSLTLHLRESRDPGDEVFLEIAGEVFLGAVIRDYSHIKDLRFTVTPVEKGMVGPITTYSDPSLEITYLETRPSRGKERT